MADTTGLQRAYVRTPGRHEPLAQARLAARRSVIPGTSPRLLTGSCLASVDGERVGTGLLRKIHRPTDSSAGLTVGG
jgi:hypothetical protein